LFSVNGKAWSIRYLAPEAAGSYQFPSAHALDAGRKQMHSHCLGTYARWPVRWTETVVFDECIALDLRMLRWAGVASHLVGSGGAALRQATFKSEAKWGQ